jgi:hypothetical protein
MEEIINKTADRFQELNENARNLIKSLSDIFPDIKESVFKRIILKRAGSTNEDLSTISELTAKKIKSELSRLTEAQIRDILIGILNQ